MVFSVPVAGPRDGSSTAKGSEVHSSEMTIDVRAFNGR